MAYYKKKPVIIEAIQFDGMNGSEIRSFTGNSGWYKDSTGNYLMIPTLEGSMRADIGDYIIKGVKGEFYPYKPDIFKETYEEINLNNN